MGNSKEYKVDDFIITWVPDKCIHSKKCWQQLGSVFKPGERPWIQPEGAEGKAIKKQIDACPSGALGYKHNTPIAQEIPLTSVEVIKNGPIIIAGNFRYINNEENKKASSSKKAFCRCGASEQKPYCDGSHNRINPTWRKLIKNN